jgi:hypothetical protein
VTQRIGLSNPNIRVLEGDASVSLAIEVLESYLLELIEEEVQLDLAELFNAIPEMIYRGVERGKSGDKVDVLVKEMKVFVRDYIVHKDELQIKIQATGLATVDIEKLKKS